MARLPSIIIEFPVLDALCNLLNKRSTGLWFYLLMHNKDMPMKSVDIIKDHGITKTVFYKCMAELELYNLCFLKNGKVYFYDHQIAHNDRSKVWDVHNKQLTTSFGNYGSIYNRRAYDPVNYGKEKS